MTQPPAPRRPLRTHDPLPGNRRSFLIWLSGAYPYVLNQVPADRPKYQGMGGAVLTTAALAGLSMFFAMTMALSASAAAAVFVAAVWFLAILNLDRWLVASLQRSARKRDILKIAIPRFLLALLFGLIISTPLVLRIFNPEVEAEITKIRIEQSEANQRSLATGSVGRQIEKLKREESTLVAAISSGGGAAVNAEADPEVVQLRKLLESLERRRDDNADAAVCEETGEKCNGHLRHDAGRGPHWREYKRKQAEAERQIAIIEKRVKVRVGSIQQSAATRADDTLNEAKGRLPAVQTELKRLRGILSAEQDAFEQENTANKGFLIRLKALNRVTGDDFTLGLSRALLFLLITTLECLPIFVKILFLIGRPTRYDELLEAYEKEHLELGKQTARKERQAGFLANNDEIVYSDYVSRERAKVLETMARSTAAVELELAQESLRLWRERELRQLPNNLDRYVARGAIQSSADPLPPLAPVRQGRGRRRVPLLGLLAVLFRRSR
ncbi:DUF4407 domain-containing protein [Nonomuraea sp. NPDC049625]|uniref:DUF4407 domain-containing protein n=1 Tax=Nonomuraea sp. NPDC049625 TaxID=3155775 RepID=UPI0034317EF2